MTIFAAGDGIFVSNVTGVTIDPSLITEAEGAPG